MNVKEFYEKTNSDYENVLRRLPNDAYILKFVKRFASETSYGELMEAVESGDVNAGFEAAHKLKGVAANMAFTDLQEAVSALTEQLRTKTELPDPALVQAVKDRYEFLVGEIRNLTE